MTIRKYIRVIILLVIVMLSACTSVKSKNNSEIPGLVKCPEERPEMCTMQYEPVCAKLLDNTLQIFSNSCSACAEKQTVAYHVGDCN